MTTAGTGIFFDGTTAIRHDVTVQAAPDAVRVRAADGRLLAEWPYGEIEHLSAPDGVLRIGRTGNPITARLEIRDPQLAHVIDERAETVDRTGGTERRGRRRVVLWSLAATASLMLVAIVGVPEIATRLTPLVPYPLEQRIGATIEVQVRRLLDDKNRGNAFVCGNSQKEKAGLAVFEGLVRQLESAAALPMPLRVAVLRLDDANAVALPGGHIYVFQGLIAQAKTPDELAGVLAHEIGHVAHRDGTRSVLQGAGISLLFGMLLGDFVGGGAVVLAARALLNTSYSRAVESAADVYSVELISRIGGDPRALGTILQRIAGSTHSRMRILLSHPDTKKRIEAIEAIARAGGTRTLLSESEWSQLKRVCAGS
jgi:Zn-dependent protease with chaperone function